MRKFLSTPSARRATFTSELHGLCGGISIHALCEEGDARATSTQHPQVHFYPRPLRGGRRSCGKGWPTFGQFLSTPSARRATRAGIPPSMRVSEFLSTPSARRATTSASKSSDHSSDFYPRPLRGGRPGGDHRDGHPNQFLSTPSARRATTTASAPMAASGYFYPRPLRGGRHHPPGSGHPRKNFYPRPLRGGRRGVP